VTPARRQQGVAVVVAVLVVALATSTAAYILWDQSLWLRQVENIAERAQADALARAAAAWAAAILAEDDPTIDHLGETWARRMPPFPAERADLAGAIADEQAKFNVNNLAGEGGANPRELVAFQHLLEAVGLPASLADAVVDWLDADNGVTAPNGAEDQHYLALDPP
jgi:general secretion pathway protein K